METLEKIKLVTAFRIDDIPDTYYGTYEDTMDDHTLVFEKGKVYGIEAEYGEGGEMLSAIMSGKIPIKEEEVYYDDVRVDNPKMGDIGWYLGKKEYSKGVIRREISARKALERAIKEYHRYQSVEEIMEDFSLRPDRIDMELSRYSGEKWRASLAIGYACKKEVFCLSWMNTSCFNSILLSSGIFRFFKRLRKEGCIFILPTSRRENVEGFVDEVIEIGPPDRKCIPSNNPYFIEHY